MKRFSRLLAALLLAAFVVAPVWAGGEAEAEDGEQQTIQIWVGWPLLMDVFERVEADYEAEHPNVDLDIAAFNLRDFEQKLAVSIPAGQGPDIFVTSEYIIPRYIEAGYIAKPPADIVEFVESNYDELVKSVNMFQAPDDPEPRIYGVPHIGIARVMYYNREMFREAGLPERAPETWDELFEFGQAVAEYDDDGNLVTGGISLRLFGGGSGIAEKFMIKLVQAGGSFLGRTEDGLYRAAYASEAGVDALSFYIDSLYKYNIDSLEIKRDSEAFLNQQTAMFQRELWPIPIYKEQAPDLDFGTAPMPAHAERGTVYSTESAFVPKSAENPELAWDVVMYFMQEEYLKAWFREEGWVPPRTDIDFSDIFEEMPEYRAAFDFPPGYKLWLYPPIAPADEIFTKFAERISDAFEDETLVDDREAMMSLLSEAAEETNQILADNDLLGEGEIVGPSDVIEAPRDLGYDF
jgi:multiple sugar transport system substrate-binding protein